MASPIVVYILGSGLGLMTLSALIDEVIMWAEVENNRVELVSTDWTKVREVVQMVLPMSDPLKARVLAETQLRYWSVDATPHDRAAEGFTDDGEMVSISFFK